MTQLVIHAEYHTKSETETDKEDYLFLESAIRHLNHNGFLQYKHNREMKIIKASVIKAGSDSLEITPEEKIDTDGLNLMIPDDENIDENTSIIKSVKASENSLDFILTNVSTTRNELTNVTYSLNYSPKTK
jgi:hypothetical protein